MLSIIDSGLQTQWTDGGREYCQMNGYSESGAIDWFSYALANALCGNEAYAPVLEIMGGNASFSVSQTCIISIAGASSDIKINGNKVLESAPLVCLLDAGDVVELSSSLGIFTYVAFSCTFTLSKFANSVCAVKRESSGGAHSNGMALKNGERFTFNNEITLPKKVRSLFHKQILIPRFTPVIQNMINQQLSVHKIIPFSFCYQEHAFSATEKQRFLACNYTVTPYMDKMGVRLKGPPVISQLTTLQSQPMANGSIQIPSDGMPIVMRNERQTIGGYPVIGTVNSQGLAILSQAVPGETLVFSATDFESSTIMRQLVDIQLKHVLNQTNDWLKQE